MSAERFEELVAEALDGIPPELGSKMDNVAVFVEDRGRQANLLGLYHGVPLTSRDAGYAGMVMPDRITIYRLPISAMCRDRSRGRSSGAGHGGARGRAPLRHRRQPLGRARLGVKFGLVGYPTRLLNDGEEIILDLKPHWMYLVPTVIVWLGATLAAIVLEQVTDQGWMWWVVLAVFLGLGVNAAVRWSKWVTTSFTVTNDRIIFRQGMVAKSGVEIPLERIMNVNFKQSIWERIIGAGDLLIESGGKDGQSRFSDVRKPELVAKEIHEQANQYEEKPARRAAAAASAGAAAAVTREPAASASRTCSCRVGSRRRDRAARQAP